MTDSICPDTLLVLVVNDGKEVVNLGCPQVNLVRIKALGLDWLVVWMMRKHIVCDAGVGPWKGVEKGLGVLLVCEHILIKIE